MFRPDGRLVEWHVVRATPRGPRASTTKKRKGPTDKQRLRSKMYNLTLDTTALRQEIMQLHQTRQLLYARHLHTKYDGDGSLVQTVRMFQQIMSTGRNLDEPFVVSFYTRTVAKDVLFGPFRGRDAMHTIWADTCRRLETSAVRAHDLRVVYVDEVAETCTILLNGGQYAVMTHDALELFFPAVLKDLVLTAKILGRQFWLNGVVHITFNAAGQIIQYNGELDLVGALMALTDDVIKTAEILEKSASFEQGLEAMVTTTTEVVELEEEVPPVDTLCDGEAKTGKTEVETEVEAEPDTVNRQSIAFLLS